MAKCAECGFLTLRNYQTGILDEVAEQYRDKWEVPAGDFYHKTNPICFVRECNLWNEVKQGLSVLDVIKNDRDCKQFTKWQQGATPKEHREMIDREKMIEWQRKERQDDKRWRIIELLLIGFFTLAAAFLGAWIARAGNP